jgi:hypothetical protein
MSPSARPVAVVAAATLVLGALTGCSGSSADDTGVGDAAAQAPTSVVVTEPTGLPEPVPAPADLEQTTEIDATDAGGRGGDPTVVPSESEAEGLTFMREEEKLARDVYLALFDEWGLPIFENIAASEQRHMDAVAALLDAYGLSDPVVDDARGAFTNADFAALYEDLVERGSQSLVDGLAVGALIEDLDIYDLRAWLAQTDNADIERVYANLLAGSENHLRAFTSHLEANGSGYTPEYLDAADVAEITAADSGRGRGRRH